jgi:hypothetical protein
VKHHVEQYAWEEIGDPLSIPLSVTHYVRKEMIVRRVLVDLKRVVRKTTNVDQTAIVQPSDTRSTDTHINRQ